MTEQRWVTRFLGISVGLTFGALASVSTAQADPCGTPTEMVKAIWEEYEKRAGDEGCSSELCFEEKDKYLTIVEEFIEAWNKAQGNSPLTIGPRRLEVGSVQGGNVVFTRKFISPPLNAPLDVSLTKLGKRAETDVNICLYPNDDRTTAASVESFTVPGGPGNAGWSWDQTLTNAKGHVVAISLNAGPGIQAMKYRLETRLHQQSEPQYVSYEMNVNRPGEDYQSFDLRRADPELCAKACEEEEKCEAYTYVKPGIQGDQARCWLKDGVPNARGSDCCVSGVKESDLPQNLHVNRPGQDYRNFTLSSADPAKCANACASEDNCEAYTYVKPGIQGDQARCWLKDGVPGTQQKEGRISGTK